MNLKRLWNRAVEEHNAGEYHEAHELFEDLWLELDERREKDTVQTLAQADALAVHCSYCYIYGGCNLRKENESLDKPCPVCGIGK